MESGGYKVVCDHAGDAKRVCGVYVGAVKATGRFEGCALGKIATRSSVAGDLLAAYPRRTPAGGWNATAAATKA